MNARNLLTVAAALFVLTGSAINSNLLAGDLPGKGVSVQPVQQNLAEEWFQTNLVSLGLKDLGYDVKEPKSVQMQAAFTAVANGDATFYAVFWYPLMKAFWEKNGGDAKLMMVGQMVDDSIQGYLIDKKTADAYKIKTINQLKDPKLAKLFDIDGDGKGDLYGCDPGWGCERTIEHQLDAYGLRDTITHKQGSYFTIIADAIERIKAGKPTLYYTWTPNWLSAVLRPGHEVEWLTVDFTALPEFASRCKHHSKRHRQHRLFREQHSCACKHQVSRGEPCGTQVVRTLQDSTRGRECGEHAGARRTEVARGYPSPR